MRHLMKGVRGVTLAIALLSFAGYADAQLPPAAQAALDKGIIAAKLPDYLLAIKYFQEARKSAPDAPAVFFNLGLAESRIPGRELRAICWFGAYLSVSPTAVNAAAVREQMDILEVKNQSNFHRILQSMEEVAKNSPDNNDNLWHQIVQIWLKYGSTSDALRAANEIPEEFYRESAKAEVANGLIASGDLDQAEQLARRLADPKPLATVLVARAEAKIRTAELKPAQELLRSAVALVEDKRTADYWFQVTTFAKSGKLQYAAGDADGGKASLAAALAICDKWSTEGDRIKPLLFVAIAQAGTGDAAGSRETLSLARTIAQKILPPKSDTESDNRSISLSEIAKAEAAIGDLSSALKTADGIADSLYKWLVLNEVARLQAKSGNVAQARTTIDSIKWGGTTEGLILIAEEQLKAGDRKGALETIQPALAPLLATKNDSGGGVTQQMAAIANVQYRAGDIPAARNTLAVAQKLCERIPDNKGYITKDNFNRNSAQNKINQVVGKIGRTDSPASPWVFYNEDSTEYDDAPLNAPLFVDFPTYWKSLLQSGDPSNVFFLLSFNAEHLVRAQRTIDDLEKERLKKP